jgi:hypothetical protein
MPAARRNLRDALLVLCEEAHQAELPPAATIGEKRSRSLSKDFLKAEGVPH